MAAIDRDRVDQLRTESFSWKLIIAGDQEVIHRTLLRWRNPNDFLDPQFSSRDWSWVSCLDWIWSFSLWERWKSAREDSWAYPFFFPLKNFPNSDQIRHFCSKKVLINVLITSWLYFRFNSDYFLLHWANLHDVLHSLCQRYQAIRRMLQNAMELGTRD